MTHHPKVIDGNEGWPGLNDMCEQPGSGIIPNPGWENEAESHSGEMGVWIVLMGLLRKCNDIENILTIYENYFFQHTSYFTLLKFNICKCFSYYILRILCELLLGAYILLIF